MHLNLIKNPDESKIILYKIARVVYAETGASSLAAVEALTSMIANVCMKTHQDITDVINDKNRFESLNENSTRHKDLLVDAAKSGFQMCLRVVNRMLSGVLPDSCNGATRFHHDDVLPVWAMSIGYIDQIDGLLFYL